MKPFGKIARQKNAVLRKFKLQLLVFWCNWSKNKRCENYDLVNAKKVLLLRLDDKIGDMVVTTGTLKTLSDAGHQVSVLAGPACEWRAVHSQVVTQKITS